MENLVNVLMNTEEIEEDGVRPNNKKNLYPLHQLMTDILIRKIQPLHTNTKLLLLSSVVVVVVDQLEDVGGSVAGMVHYGKGYRNTHGPVVTYPVILPGV